MTLRIGTYLSEVLFCIIMMRAFLACTKDNKLSQESKSPGKISSNLLNVINLLLGKR